MRYFLPSGGPLKCVTPCATEFIALSLGEKYPCVVLASDDKALFLWSGAEVEAEVCVCVCVVNDLHCVCGVNHVH